MLSSLSKRGLGIQCMGIVMCSVLALACGGGGGSQASSTSTATTPTPAPTTTDPIAQLAIITDTATDDTTGTFFGIFRETSDHAGLVNTVETDYRHAPAHITWFQAWSGQPDFPTTEVQQLWAKGVMANITWEPWDPTIAIDAASQIHLQDIVDGGWDTYITKWAKAAADADTPFLLRWGHEMNGNWYPWAGALNGSNSAAAALYVMAYKHIHDIFIQQGAVKVKWVWCPGAASTPSATTWNEHANYYPGDSYVDWIGLDAYNWGTTQSWSSWTSFTDLYSGAYTSIQTISSTKPIMICEFASAELGGNKASWIKDVFAVMPTAFPRIKAFTWFDNTKETAWAVRSSETSYEAFSYGLRNTWVRGSGVAMNKVVAP